MNGLYKLPIFILPVLAVLCNFIQFQKIRRLSIEACDVQSSKDQLIHLIKKRYSDCITLGKPIRNVNSFVQKFFYNNNATLLFYRGLNCFLKLCFFSLLCFYLFYNIFPTEKLIITGVFALFIFHSASEFFSTSYYEKKFESSMCDYLDNTFFNRLTAKKESAETLEKAKDDSLESQKIVDFTKKCTISDNENAIIASIINDFL